MECNACQGALNSKDFMKCRLCIGKFHYECLNIELKTFRSYTNEYKSTWVCPMCTNITHRGRSKDGTPVRTKYALAQGDDSMNMSYESYEPNANIVTHAPSTTAENPAVALTGPNVAVTMENISALLDLKLNASRREFMETFRKALREDVKEMVKHEIESTIKRVTDDFTTTTDFICDEQKSLRSSIDTNVEKINTLEKEKNRLQEELARLNARLIGMEKISRSCNIEMQAVPERKNENVMGLLKKLCDVIKLPLDDGKVSACRRVAKHNANSSRPRNIVVTFATPLVRDMVLSAAHRYIKANRSRGLTSVDLDIPGETCKIYVTEHLSPEQKSLHAAARRACKERGYKYVWIKYGQIYMRKDDSSGAILIKCLDSLNKLR